MPRGRPKGSKNVSTERTRRAITLLTDHNLSRMQDWLDEVAAENPAEAMRLMLAMLEFSLPKLARVEAELEHKGSITSYIVVPAKTGVGTDPETG